MQVSPVGQEGRSWRRHLGVALLLVLTLLFSGSPVRAEEPAVHFGAPEPLLLSTSPSKISIVNDSNETWGIAVSTTFNSADGTPIELIVEGAPAGIEPAGTVVLTVSGIPAQTSSASGFIVLTATSAGVSTVSRRALSYTQPTPKPRVNDWFGTSEAELTSIPLDNSNCGSISSGDAILTAGVEIATMRYSCKANDPNDAVLAMDAAGIDAIGKYTGKLAIGESNVALTYLRTSAWGFVLIPMILGIILAAAHTAWVDNYRPLRRAGNRLTQVGIAALESQATFEREAAQATYRVYNITQGAMREVSQLQLRLTAMQPSWWKRWLLSFWPWSKAEQQSEFEEVVKSMEALDAAAGSWASASDAMAELRTGLDEARHTRNDRLAPSLISHLDELIDPSKGGSQSQEADLTKSSDLIAEVHRSTVALKLLPRLVELEELLERVKPTPQTSTPSDIEVYRSAVRNYRALRAEFAAAHDVNALEAARVDQLLVTTRAMALQLEPAKPIVDLQDAAPPAGLPEVGTVAAIPALQEALARAVAAVRSIDAAWLLVAIAVTLWSGFVALYVDKPWGTWQDYVAAFVWAYGGTAVLTAVLTSLQNVAAPPMELKKPDVNRAT